MIQPLIIAKSSEENFIWFEIQWNFSVNTCISNLIHRLECKLFLFSLMHGTQCTQCTQWLIYNCTNMYWYYLCLIKRSRYLLVLIPVKQHRKTFFVLIALQNGFFTAQILHFNKLELNKCQMRLKYKRKNISYVWHGIW